MRNQRLSFRTENSTKHYPVQKFFTRSFKYMQLIVAFVMCTSFSLNESSTLINLLSPSVVTDKLDYAPGEYALITASGFTTSTSIKFIIDHVIDPGPDGQWGTSDDIIEDLGGNGHDNWYVTDGLDDDGAMNGTLQTNWYVDPDDSADARLLLRACAVTAGSDGVFNTADDVFTGEEAYHSFTDSPGDFSLDFVASAPESYDHDFGGGAFDLRDVGVADDIVESLEGGDFACGDVVTYLVEISVDNTQGAIDDSPQTIELDFQFLANTTGQAGVAHSDIISVGINYPPIVDIIAGENNIDEGISDDGGSTATLINECTGTNCPGGGSGNGIIYVPGALTTGTVIIDDLEAGETVVLRVDTRLSCDPFSNPTGNLQAAITGARNTFINGTTPVGGNQNISVGNQTVPFKQIGNITFVDLSLVKTVNNPTPNVGEIVTFSIEVFNQVAWTKPLI